MSIGDVSFWIFCPFWDTSFSKHQNFLGQAKKVLFTDVLGQAKKVLFTDILGQAKKVLFIYL